MIGRTAGSVRFDPYYKIQTYDPRSLTWRDVQRSYPSAADAVAAFRRDHTDPSIRVRVMEVTEAGRAPVPGTDTEEGHTMTDTLIAPTVRSDSGIVHYAKPRAGEPETLVLRCNGRPAGQSDSDAGPATCPRCITRYSADPDPEAAVAPEPDGEPDTADADAARVYSTRTTLADLVNAGLVPAGATLTAKGYGQTWTAQVEADGTLTMNGEQYPSPSAAVKGIKTAAGAARVDGGNGWAWWHTADGELLGDVRDRLA